jgi:hypothetical protein
MPLYTDWKVIKENGLRVEHNTLTPLSGTSSLRMESNGTEFSVTAPGFRKSASIFLHDGFHPRGFSDGRIQTLIRRNSTNQSAAWGGVYILSDREGIGTRLDPGDDRYEITDKDGTIKVIKFVSAVPTILFDTGSNFGLNTIHGFEVDWEFDFDLTVTKIRISLGTNIDFSDLVQIANVVDNTDPLQFSESEGFFVQAQLDTDFVSYTFDKTTLVRIQTL